MKLIHEMGILSINPHILPPKLLSADFDKILFWGSALTDPSTSLIVGAIGYYTPPLQVPNPF
jgi:hypothetical protein